MVRRTAPRSDSGGGSRGGDNARQRGDIRSYVSRQVRTGAELSHDGQLHRRSSSSRKPKRQAAGRNREHPSPTPKKRQVRIGRPADRTVRGHDRRRHTVRNAGAVGKKVHGASDPVDPPDGRPRENSLLRNDHPVRRRLGGLPGNHGEHMQVDTVGQPRRVERHRQRAGRRLR